MKKVLKGLEAAFKWLIRVIVLFFLILYCKIVYRYKIIGRKNIPKKGALIFCGNHRTYLDPPLIAITSSRRMRFMGKIELRKNLFLRFLGYAFDVIYVKRDSKDIKPLIEAMRTLKSGGCIGIFPEGTRNGLEKNNGKIKNGATYMSLKTGAQIVPIGIKGIPKPFHKVTISYGKPLDFSKLLEKGTPKEVEGEASEILKNEILMLTK